MYENIFAETLYIEKLYGEYISTVNRYQNVNRPSIFGRYLNINKDASTFNADNNSVFDRYNSGIQYDIYDYTPLFFTSQVLNDASDNSDMKGQQFAGPLNVTIYTIEKPRIEDLLIFNRPPQKGIEIFRVNNIRASINAMESSPNANWFELTLEYAPLVDINKLNFLNHYAYSLPLQKYIFATEFERHLKDTEKMAEMLTSFQAQSFNQKYEVFTFVNEDGRVIAPLLENHIIYNFLAFKSQYQDHFNNIYRPYGCHYHGGYDDPGDYALDISTGKLIRYSPSSISFVDRIIDQEGTPNIYQLAHLIGLWIWERDKGRYPEFKPKQNSTFPNLEYRLGNDLEAVVKCNPKIGLTADISKLPLNSFKG